MPGKRTILVAGLLLAGLVYIGTAMGIPSSDDASPPAEATAQADDGAAAAALTVEVTQPEVETWPVEVRASGWLEAWREAVISAEVGGQRIEEVNVDVGDTVAKGDVLATLSRETLENDIQQLEAALDSASAALGQASADADRARRLESGGSISQQQIAETLVLERQATADVAAAEAALSSARLELDRTRIVAVSDGVISGASAAIGDVVTAGEELFRMIRDGRIEWRAEVPLIGTREVEIGTTARIPAPSGDIFGTVRQIAPSVSETNGRVVVYVALEAPEDGPPPKTGIMVSGVLETGARRALSLPASAVVLQDGFAYVYVLDEGDPATVTRRRVETGRRQDDRVEITGDFPAGARVVRAGGAFLSDGATVRVVEETPVAGDEVRADAEVAE